MKTTIKNTVKLLAVILFMAFGISIAHAQSKNISLEEMALNVDYLPLSAVEYSIKTDEGNFVNYGTTNNWNYFSFDLNKKQFKRVETHKIYINENTYSQETRAVHQFEVDEDSINQNGDIYTFKAACITENNMNYRIAIKISSPKRVALFNETDTQRWKFFDN